MHILVALLSLALIVLVLLDAFETMLLPRRVTRMLRLARLFYRSNWTLWRAAGHRIPPGKRREYFLSLFGPSSLLGLIATWAVGLITGFALLQWSLGMQLHAPEAEPGLGAYFYLSAVTFFTLGYGELTPGTALGRAVCALEAGLGFGFMAVVIGYLPVLYQAFSRREVTISLLDARAGSPPTAAQVLVRLSQAQNLAAIDPLLAEWERWSAELLESHLSFPVLSYYRSQHDNQSWLAAITAVLDTCALLIVGVKGADSYQAQLTFAMARHAVVDLAMVFKTPPIAPERDRLPQGRLLQLRQALRQAGLVLRDGEAVDKKLKELRAMYEPFVHGLARFLLFTLPPVLPEKAPIDNWQTSAWMQRAPGFGRLPLNPEDDHLE